MKPSIKLCEPTITVTLTAHEGNEKATMKAVLPRISRSEAKALIAANASFEPATEAFLGRILSYQDVPTSEAGVTIASTADADAPLTTTEVTAMILESQSWMQAAFNTYARTLHGLPDVEKEADLGN